MRRFLDSRWSLGMTGWVADKLKFAHHLTLKEGTLWTLAVVPAILSEVAKTGCP